MLRIANSDLSVLSRRSRPSCVISHRIGTVRDSPGISKAQGWRGYRLSLNALTEEPVVSSKVPISERQERGRILSGTGAGGCFLL